MTRIPDGPELLGGLKPAAVTTMATPVMGVLVTPGEPAVGPPGHEPAASAAKGARTTVHALYYALYMLPYHLRYARFSPS